MPLPTQPIQDSIKNGCLKRHDVDQWLLFFALHNILKAYIFRVDAESIYLPWIRHALEKIVQYHLYFYAGCTVIYLCSNNSLCISNSSIEILHFWIWKCSILIFIPFDLPNWSTPNNMETSCCLWDTAMESTHHVFCKF